MPQPIAPTSGPLVDPLVYVRQPDEIPPEDLAGLEDSLLAQCHGGGPASLRGLDCLQCSHFRGLLRYRETGRPDVDYRGLCGAPDRRPLVKGRLVSAVRCLEAPSKVKGAKRGDRINATHCHGCAWNVSLDDEASVCSSPRGVRYVALCVG